MILIAFVAGAFLAAQGTAGASDDLTVLGAHFYAQDLRGGEPRISETTTIPLRPNTSCYGWSLEVPPRAGSVAIREVFELPGAGQWGIVNSKDEVSAVTSGRNAAVTEFQAPLNEGVIAHSWCVAPGAPAGPHRIRVFQGDRLLHEFRFELVAERL